MRGRIISTVAAITLLPAVAFAAEEGGGGGFLASAFLTFGSLIISVKLIPGIIRFAGIIAEEREAALAEEKPVE